MCPYGHSPEYRRVPLPSPHKLRRQPPTPLRRLAKPPLCPPQLRTAAAPREYTLPLGRRRTALGGDLPAMLLRTRSGAGDSLLRRRHHRLRTGNDPTTIPFAQLPLPLPSPATSPLTLHPHGPRQHPGNEPFAWLPVTLLRTVAGYHGRTPSSPPVIAVRPATPLQYGCRRQCFARLPAITAGFLRHRPSSPSAWQPLR